MKVIVSIICIVLGMFMFMHWASYHKSDAKSNEEILSNTPPPSIVNNEQDYEYTKEEAELASELAVPLKYDLVFGESKAPVTIVEYSSLACPHCGEYHKDILPKLKEEYIDTGKVRYIYRDFPTNQPALFGALLSHCDSKNRAKWLSVLFESQEKWAYSKDFQKILENMANLSGFSEAKKCFEDKALIEGVMESSFIASKKYEIKATPIFFINGKKIEGSERYLKLKERIERILSKK